uniref:Dynamin-related protein 3B n=1 Tax=Aegilops tauschii TaxID=37682 RepID=M8BXQ4_AEGTA
MQAETDREAGGNKGVSDRQIRLKIYSPNVLNITLVDLPGITKVPVGDQPTDIEARIRTMILSYIKHKTCIILAVSPANADLANSDALQMARQADPDGSRTIGVITKLDIMDRGTDARNFLLGNVIPLRLGYVGVVNRSQQSTLKYLKRLIFRNGGSIKDHFQNAVLDINSDVSVKQALAREESFFRSHPAYNGLAKHCGIPQLAKKLNQILVQHIRTILPGLKARISSQLTAIAKEHAFYGDPVESKAGQGAKLLNILAKYCDAFSSMVEGKNEDISTIELSGGARIHYIFQSIFVKSLEGVDPCEDVTDEDIRMAIQNATGPRSALFVPEVPFEVLVRRQISRLLDPSLQCADFIYEELVKMSHRCLCNELQQFPILRRSMDEVIGKFLRDGLKPAQDMIAHIIEMEADYINTSHPSFIGGSKAVEQAQQQVRAARLPATVVRRNDLNAIHDDPVMLHHSGYHHINMVSDLLLRQRDQDLQVVEALLFGAQYSPQAKTVHILQQEPPLVLKPSESHSEQEDLEIAITKLLLQSYYNIVRKNVEDFVPKAIMHFLVNHTKRELHNFLITTLYREELFGDILREPDEITTKRRQIRDTLKVLQQAYKTLDEIPLEAETVERGYSLDSDATGLPRHSMIALQHSMIALFGDSFLMRTSTWLTPCSAVEERMGTRRKGSPLLCTIFGPSLRMKRSGRTEKYMKFQIGEKSSGVHDDDDHASSGEERKMIPTPNSVAKPRRKEHAEEKRLLKMKEIEEKAAAELWKTANEERLATTKEKRATTKQHKVELEERKVAPEDLKATEEVHGRKWS